MKRKSKGLATVFATATVLLAGCGQSDSETPDSGANTSTDLAAVSTALERYGNETVLTELWERPGLAPRDRSIVTVSSLIARGQSGSMPFYFNRALDDGVTPAELSEIITHLAFYAGWPDAMTAVEAARGVFTKRDISTDDLPAADVELLPIDVEWDNNRITTNDERYGDVGPGVLDYTTDVLFHDLWLRPDLAPRDRSLVTVSALVATGGTGQMTSHLNKAMDNGLTQEQAGEVLTQLAFYSGWPRVFTAMPVFKEIFESRPA